MTLSHKQRIFVARYLTHWNATRAAVEAGYSEKSARSIASENLTKPDISAEIDRRLKERQLSADEVLARLGDMARSDIADFAGVRSITDLEAGEYQGKTHVIKKFKSKITKDALGRQVEEVELELYPADGALERVGRHHGLFTDKIEIKLEKEIDTILDTLETLLDADSYQRVLQALSARSSDGQAGAGETTETEE